MNAAKGCDEDQVFDLVLASNRANIIKSTSRQAGLHSASVA